MFGFTFNKKQANQRAEQAELENFASSLKTHSQVIKTADEIKAMPLEVKQELNEAFNTDRANYLNPNHEHGQKTKEVARKYRL